MCNSFKRAKKDIVIKCDIDTDLLTVLKTMIDHIHHVYIHEMGNDTLIGVVSYIDIIKNYFSYFYFHFTYLLC